MYKRQTEGLPFFVAEYLHMLAHDPAAGAGAAWRAPTSVRDFLHARLAPVTEVGRQVLAAAAVIGRSFDLATVTAASGRSDDEAVTALEELLALRLVVEADAERVDFSHAQLRQVVYDELTHLRRRLLHRRVADALATAARRTGSEESAAGSLAHHYQLGGEHEKGAHFAFVAGEQARRVYANRAAIAYFEQALALGAPARCAAYTHLGDLHTLAGEYGRAEQAYLAALAACDAGQRADLEHRLGRLCERRGDATDAAQHFAAAAALLPPTATAHRAQLLTDWSLSVARTQDLTAAVHLAEAGLAAASAAGDGAALAPRPAFNFAWTAPPGPPPPAALVPARSAPGRSPGSSALPPPVPPQPSPQPAPSPRLLRQFVAALSPLPLRVHLTRWQRALRVSRWWLQGRIWTE